MSEEMSLDVSNSELQQAKKEKAKLEREVDSLKRALNEMTMKHHFAEKELSQLNKELHALLAQGRKIAQAILAQDDSFDLGS